MPAEAATSAEPYGLAVEIGAAVLLHVVIEAHSGCYDVTDTYLDGLLHTIEAHTKIARSDHTPEILEQIARLARDTVDVIKVGQKTPE